MSYRAVWFRAHLKRHLNSPNGVKVVARMRILLSRAYVEKMLVDDVDENGWEDLGRTWMLDKGKPTGTQHCRTKIIRRRRSTDLYQVRTAATGVGPKVRNRVQLPFVGSTKARRGW